MNIRADYCDKYFRRFLYIFIGCAAYSAYCLYDALIGYPPKFEPAKIYHVELKGSTDRSTEWQKIATEKGWSTYVPKTVEEIENDISQQYAQIILCSVIGLPMLLKYLAARGSFVQANENEIKPSWKKAIALDSIKKIDKTKWAEKGIAVVSYQVNNVANVFKLDDFKFDRKPMTEIIRLIESKLGDDAIIGGEREKPKTETANPAPGETNNSAPT